MTLKYPTWGEPYGDWEVHRELERAPFTTGGWRCSTCKRFAGYLHPTGVAETYPKWTKTMLDDVYDRLDWERTRTA